MENIPEQLRERPQWVTWCLEERDGKQTKVPYVASLTGPKRKASATNLLTWRRFDTAVLALEVVEAGGPHYDGIGFVLSSGDPYVGIDLDDCRNLETGELDLWAEKIVTAFEPTSYIEQSPSGRGIHIITTATLEEAVKTPHIEIYSQARYFTITGRGL